MRTKQEFFNEKAIPEEGVMMGLKRGRHKDNRGKYFFTRMTMVGYVGQFPNGGGRGKK